MIIKKQNIVTSKETFLRDSDYQSPKQKNKAAKKLRHSIYGSSITYLFLVLISSIFVGESVVAMLISTLPPLSQIATILLDSTLLLISIIPFLYFFVVRPMSVYTTRRKQAIETICNERVLLRTLIDNIPDSIYCKDLACRKTLANSAEIHFLNANSEDEVLGKDDFDFYPKELAEGFFADDQLVIKTGKPVLNREEYIPDENGKKRWLLSSKLPLRDKDGQIIGLVGIGRDITERKLAEEALSKTEELYHNLVERLPDGVYKSTHEGKFVEVNPAMVAMLGYKSKEELMAIDIKTQLYYEPSDRESTELLEMHEEIGIYRLKTKNGSAIWVEDHGWYIPDENNNILFHEGIMRNITERKLAEEEIKHKNKELLKLNAEKDKFFSIIAHDLRSPFNGFLGLTQIMAEELQGLSSDELQEIALSLRSSATNLYHLLENLLEWSRIHQGLIRFTPETIQLLPIVSESLAAQLEPAKSKRIEIAYNIPNDLIVFADRYMLQTVIRNLFSNAVKFTPKEGKVSLSAEVTADKCVVISIKDSGIGMNHKMINDLFRLDVQTNRKGTDGENSTGLGLFLSKEFIEKHGGRIWVESEEGKGSVFYFTIPADYSLL